MIQALLEKDKLSREEIANMARGKLKSKVDQLVETLNGKVTDHHRFLLRLHLDNIAFLAEQIQEINERMWICLSSPLTRTWHLGQGCVLKQ